jgi:hypothetical protein
LLPQPTAEPYWPRLIRQKSGAITGARPTGRVGTAKDDDGEQPTPARLRKSRRAPGRKHGRHLRIRSFGQCQRHIAGPPDASSAIQNVLPSQEVGLLIGVMIGPI